MELDGYNNGEQGSSLVRELTKQLKSQMGSGISGKPKGVLVEGILCSYENALLLLNNGIGGSMELSRNHVVLPCINVPGSPISFIGSPKSEDLNPGFNAQQGTTDFSRKRKKMSTWREQLKVKSENGLEEPPDDGYSWRKYGQKDILGDKHPRSYFRCTYRNLRGCCATKQVQRSDEDFSVFNLTYKGKHTCTIVPRSKSAPVSPEKQQRNKNHNHNITRQKPDVLLNFQRDLSVEIHNLENHTLTPSILNRDSFFSDFPQLFIPSPVNSASNYFSRSACNLTYGAQYGEHCESDIITEVISGAASGTNSPIIGMDYPIEQLEHNPDFRYDHHNQVFFPSN